MQSALWEFWAIYLIIANFSAIFAQKLALIKSIAQNLYKLNIFGTFWKIAVRKFALMKFAKGEDPLDFLQIMGWILETIKANFLYVPKLLSNKIMFLYSQKLNKVERKKYANI